jgi:autotransporter-associated beta strand protein
MWAALALLSFATANLLAADTTWISTSSSAWGTAGNWSAGTPNASLGTIFPDSGTIQHTIDIGGGAATSIGFRFDSFAGGGGFTIGNSSGLSIRSGGTANGILNNDDSTQTFNLPISLLSLTGFTGSGASQTWNASAGNLIFSGVYGGTAATVNNNGGRLTIDGGFNTTIGTTGRGDIIGNGGLTKNGAGILTLGGTNANTYVGSTILNAGSIVAAKANAFGTSALTLNGGSLNSGGFNQNFGVLTLAGVSSMDLGSGASALVFLNSSGATWSGSLQILNYTEGVDSIRVGTTSSGLTAQQLQLINFDIPETMAQLDANGFLVPVAVPEPSTTMLAVLGGFGYFALTISRRRKK